MIGNFGTLDGTITTFQSTRSISAACRFIRLASRLELLKFAPGKRQIVKEIFSYNNDTGTLAELEKITNYARLLPHLVFASWLGGVVVVYVCWKSASNPVMLWWLGGYSAHLAYRIYWYLRFVREATVINYRRENIDQILSGVISGSLWGWAPILFGEIGLENRLLIYWLVCTYCGLGVMVSGFNPLAYGIAVAAALIPLEIHLLSFGTNFDSGLAFMVVIAAIAVSATARRHCIAMNDLINLKIQNQAIAEALETQNELLKQSNTGKSRLISAASHDLRQPVYGLTLMMNKMRERCRLQNLPPGNQSPPMSDESEFDQVELALQHLAKSISNLLDLSRLEGGALTVEITNVSLGELFTRLTYEFSAQAAAKKIQLRVPPSDFFVIADHSLLHSILSNLLANAITYSNGGKISLVAKRRGENYRILVIDQGEGISEDILRNGRLFQEYFRASNRSTTISSAGLGLAIADRFAKAMSTEIKVISRIGKGSCFSIAFPRCLPPNKPSRTIMLPGGAATQGFGNLPVMLVSDSPPDANKTLRLLEENDATVSCCSTLMEAFMWAKKTAVGILLVDLQKLRNDGHNQDSWMMTGRIANLSDTLLVVVLIDQACIEGALPQSSGVQKCRLVALTTSPLKLKSILLREINQRLLNASTLRTAPESTDAPQAFSQESVKTSATTATRGNDEY